MAPANRLIHEKSPYLLQHAYNPVDWRPWNEESFAAAKAGDKPIFLSVGYSTCHWCHVMERESFENEAVAEILNRDFIAIKVDREERPDVDRIYMLYVQATTGSGGWPMSVFLTPDLQAFYGGTYFPPENRYGRPGFKTVLTQLAAAWKHDRERVLRSSQAVLGQLKEITRVEAGTAILDDAKVIESLYLQTRRGFDAERGGFGSAPKFPRPVTLRFLLRHYYLTQNEESLDMVLKTLAEMALGGMNDQLGGGFHRYSVDAHWFVPHFEKMLYDQAQLAQAYLEAFQLTHNPAFAQVARDIFTYVLRDLRHPEGGFYSAEDADSVIDPAEPHEKGEGAFYIWTWDELEALVGADRMEWFARRYGVERGGNVHEDPHAEFTGRNILSIANPATDPISDELRDKLLAYRGRRPRPHLDDKVLTAWNGLMISAFAMGARVLGETAYARAAEDAIAFVRSRLRQPDGGLLRRFREGEAAIPGFLDDYAFFAEGLLDTYEATGETPHLELARDFAVAMCERFEDSVEGGFYSTLAGDENLVLRLKEDYDGAEPSGNSVAADVLARLAVLTGEERFAASANRLVRAFAGRLTAQPLTMPRMVCSLMRLRQAPRQIVFAGEYPAELETLTDSRYLPLHARIQLKTAAQREFFAWSPALAAMTKGVFVCENFTCQLPAFHEAELLPLLQ
jgi:uncharacterized protein YyaL (SSP411 family)